MKLHKKTELKKNDGYYFPLFNLKGMRSSMTPYFGGDVKVDQHHYALEPTTEVDLYHNISSRNVVFCVDDTLYFLNGQTAHQQNDELTYETGLLYQRVTRQHKTFKIEATSFVAIDENIELHEIKFTNTSSKTLNTHITTAIPIYARSADNLRDHRHVTSLLNQTEVVKEGIIVKPTLSFDERGHQINDTYYAVFAKSEDLSVKGYIPVLDDFVNGGSLHFPKGLDVLSPVGTTINGYEAMGAIQFEAKDVLPDETITFYVSIGIHQAYDQCINAAEHYLNRKQFHQSLKESSNFYTNYVNGLSFEFHDDKTSDQLSWITLQPLLRRYFGNSYLPHHDYGHGGKGWRDLWQDLLSLIMMGDPRVIDLLYNNFLGVRIDGSNATIIGDQPGEFKADRNMITRVWSDHGAWPLLTVKLYIDETGDLDFLLKKQGYFMDQFTHYTKQTREKTKTTYQTTKVGTAYEGSILEHLLLQNLVGHLNVGPHGFVRLEDADWNDGLDMAHQKGETIAFTHMYANNLKTLKTLISALNQKEIELFRELKDLLVDHLSLNQFFDDVSNFSGESVKVDKNIIIEILGHLYEKRLDHLQKHAFKTDKFQSYFNNDSNDPDTEKTASLTGQTMALLSETATSSQAKQVAIKIKELLYEPSLGGYKLNSDYQKILTNMGRAYGFAYGHKENGAMFSHMAVMYAYGLYQYNLVSYGREAFMALLKKAQDPSSKVWVGIPEYFSDRGIGMYPYLTGSASWMLMLIRNRVFGVQMKQGILYLEPQLSKDDFIYGKASIKTYIFNRLTKITYHNSKDLDFGAYQISNILINGKSVTQGIKHTEHDIEVYLDEIL